MKVISPGHLRLLAKILDRSREREAKLAQMAHHLGGRGADDRATKRRGGALAVQGIWAAAQAFGRCCAMLAGGIGEQQLEVISISVAEAEIVSFPPTSVVDIDRIERVYAVKLKTVCWHRLAEQLQRLRMGRGNTPLSGFLLSSQRISCDAPRGQNAKWAWSPDEQLAPQQPDRRVQTATHAERQAVR